MSVKWRKNSGFIFRICADEIRRRGWYGYQVRSLPAIHARASLRGVKLQDLESFLRRSPRWRPLMMRARYTHDLHDTHARAQVLQDIERERERQVVLWGPDDDKASGTWLAILMEEVGEAATALLEGDELSLEIELTSVAAVCVAWREARLRG